jgi:hypothetical protein
MCSRQSSAVLRTPESEMKIITNNRPRPMACFADLPAKVQADFDYVMLADHYSPRFVQYKGEWYDVYDSQSITRELGFSQFAGWHGIQSDSFFSGVLFKLCDDDTVIVGRYFS